VPEEKGGAKFKIEYRGFPIILPPPPPKKKKRERKKEIKQGKGKSTKLISHTSKFA
jgi:hypothetical protein